MDRVFHTSTRLCGSDFVKYLATATMAAINGMSDDTLLKTPDTDTEHPSQERATSTYMPHPTYRLPKGDERHYQQQYADMYFARLVQLKPAVEHVKYFSIL